MSRRAGRDEPGCLASHCQGTGVAEDLLGRRIPIGDFSGLIDGDDRIETGFEDGGISRLGRVPCEDRFGGILFRYLSARLVFHDRGVSGSSEAHGLGRGVRSGHDGGALLTTSGERLFLAAALAYASKVAAAVRRQSNSAARTSPLARNSFRARISPARRVSCVWISVVLSGSRMAAASPMTSPNAPEVEDRTGHPQAIASMGGRPKPSKSEGKTNKSAAR